MVRAARGEAIERAPCWCVPAAATPATLTTACPACNVSKQAQQCCRAVAAPWRPMHALCVVCSAGIPAARRAPPPPQLSRCSRLNWSAHPLPTTCTRPSHRMMRQAGRYQKAYRDLALKHPSFRERSENTDLIVEISLQPWESFKPDGVILFRCGGGWKEQGGVCWAAGYHWHSHQCRRMYCRAACVGATHQAWQEQQSTTLPACCLPLPRCAATS